MIVGFIDGIIKHFYSYESLLLLIIGGDGASFDENLGEFLMHFKNNDILNILWNCGALGKYFKLKRKKQV